MFSVATIVGAALVFAPIALCQTPAPSAAEQQRMLENTRRYASRYLTNLPNFICLQVTSQFQSGRRANHWKKGDILASKLMFSQGHEERTLELVNNKPVKPGRFPRTPLKTEGEFGTLIGNVLDGDTDAVVDWDHWEDLRGARLAVFKYSVAREHSTLSLTLSDRFKTIVPYRGLIFSDPATGAIWRITNTPYNIPAAILTRSITTTIDYGSVSIGGQSYLLPLAASVLLDTGSDNLLNQTEYRGYRKFETESKITFASDSDLPPGNALKPAAGSSAQFR